MYEVAIDRAVDNANTLQSPRCQVSLTHAVPRAECQQGETGDSWAEGRRRSLPPHPHLSRAPVQRETREPCRVPRRRSQGNAGAGVAPLHHAVAAVKLDMPLFRRALEGPESRAQADETAPHQPFRRGEPSIGAGGDGQALVTEGPQEESWGAGEGWAAVADTSCCCPGCPQQGHWAGCEDSQALPWPRKPNTFHQM